MGRWSVGEGEGNVGADYIHDRAEDRGTKSVTYTPDLPAGLYRVSVWWPAFENRATAVPIDVRGRDGTRTVRVNQTMPVGAQGNAQNTNTAAAEGDTMPSTVEAFDYPGAAQILATQNIRLLTGDGHILLADCATQPVNNVGVIKVFTTALVGTDGSGEICFKVNASVGFLSLEVPGVFEIQGDGQSSGNGHPLTAVLTTETGPPVTVVCDPSGSTQVGMGADPDADPTTLLQLRVPS